MANKFLTDIELDAGLKDNSNGLGTSGQVLSSTGTGVSWIDSTSDTAERIEVTVKNVSGAQLAKGTVVHAAPTATPPSGNVIEIIAADYDTASAMPAIGVLNETINDEAEGAAVMMGAVSGIDTDSFNIGDELYVGNNGTFTNSKPTATNQLIQKMAVVIKKHASNGLIKVFGAGRSNDVPNLVDRTINFADDAQLRIGDGSDLRIRHNGTNTFLENYTGALYIDQNTDDGSIIFRNDDGSGGVASYIQIKGSSEETLFTRKIRLNDNITADFGTARDLQIYHDGANSYIETSTSSAGDLYIKSQGTNHDLYLQAVDDIFIRPQGGENGIVVTGNGAVSLYYDNSKKLETTSAGVTVTGDGDALVINRGSFNVVTSLTSVNHNIISTGKAFNIKTSDSNNLAFSTDNTIALTLDTSQNATFAGQVIIQDSTSQPLSSLFEGTLVVQGSSDEDPIIAITDVNTANAAAGVFHQSSTSPGFPALVINAASNGSEQPLISARTNVSNTTGIGGTEVFAVDGDGDATFAGAISGASIDLSNYAQIQVDDAEMYWTNAANTDYWRWKRDASNNFILDHYNGSSTTSALTFNSSQNATFTGQIKTTNTSGFLMDSGVDMSMSYFNNVPSTSYGIFSSNNHADTIISTNLKLDGNHDVVTNQSHSAIKGSGIVFTGNLHHAGAGAIAMYALGSGTATAGTVTAEENYALLIKDTSATFAGDVNISNSSGVTLNMNTNLAGNTSKILLHEGTTASPANGASIRYDGSANEFRIGVGTNVDTTRLTIDRSTGAAHFTGNVEVGDGTNISMDASANGQLMIDGSGYQGAIALDGTAMYVYHNSSGRNLVLGTNETARLTIAGSTGNATFASNVTIEGGTLNLSDGSQYDSIINAGSSLTLNFDDDNNSTGEVFRINHDTTGLNANNLFSITESGVSTASASFRAPIFYDTDNTDRYLDPADRSRLRHLELYQNGDFDLYVSDNDAWCHMDARDEGTVAALHKYTRSNSTGYGVYKEYWYDGNSYQSISQDGDQFVFSTSIKAPVFYDSDDTDYYVNPNSSSKLSGLKLEPQSSVNQASGDDNVLWIYRVNNNDWGIQINADQGSATDYGYEFLGGSSHTYAFSAVAAGTRYFNVGSGFAQHSSSFRAPVFYDSNDTNYYADPTSRSNFGDLDLNSGDVWNATIQGRNKGSLHIDPNSSTDHAGGSITWGASDNGNGQIAHAGIYVRSDGTYGTRMYLSTTDSYSAGSKTTIRLEAGGGLYVDRGNMYAPIFYDLNDTNYYVNPNNNGTCAVFRGYQIFNDYGAGVVGTYSSYRYQLVFAMGNSYKGALDGTSVSGGYGLWYSHPDAGGVAANLNSHGLMNIENGNWRASFSGSTRAFYDMRAPIFYDLGNTGYYIDPSSDSLLAGDLAFNGGAIGSIADGASTANQVSRILIPQGGAGSWDSGQTGAIKIRLPIRANNNMWTMKVRIYNYSTSQSEEYFLGNYSYSAGGYNSHVAFHGGENSTPKTVRFGNDGTYDCVWIGETNTTWSYPVVSVLDFQAGFRTASVSANVDNYDVSIATSFGTVGTTIAPNTKAGNVVYAQNSFRAPLFYDSNNTNYYTDPNSLSAMHSLKLIQYQNHTPRWDFSAYVVESPHHYSTSSTGDLYVGESNTIYLRTTAITTGNHRAPIYYDYTNTGYYANPDSNSNLYSVSLYNISTISRLQSGGNLNGSNNFAFGNSSTLGSATAGSSNNAAIGYDSQASNSSGDSNFSFGYASLYSLSSGSNNIAIGDATGYNVTSGSNNLLFGHNAGRTGYQTPQSIAGITTGSNQIHMGNESHTTARIQISWTVNSDARDKTDVTPIDVGLDFVNQLNPVTFRWDKRSDYEDRTPTGENKLEELTLGFLAQEVEEVEKSYGYDVATKTNLVVDRDVEQDHYGITYEKMIPILTKAIQEQQTIIDDLKSRLETLENQ